MATVPSEMTAVAGAVLTAAQWNSNVRDAINFLINRPVCEVRQTVAQSVASGGPVGINMDTEDIDNDGMHSTVTNTSRATAVTAGRYRVSGAVGFAGNTTGRREAEFGVNGSAVSASAAIIAAATTNPLVVAARSRTVFLNVGDYVEIWGVQDSGGALNTDVNASEQPSLCVHWIGTT